MLIKGRWVAGWSGNEYIGEGESPEFTKYQDAKNWLLLTIGGWLDGINDSAVRSEYRRARAEIRNSRATSGDFHYNMQPATPVRFFIMNVYKERGKVSNNGNSGGEGASRDSG